MSKLNVVAAILALVILGVIAANSFRSVGKMSEVIEEQKNTAHQLLILKQGADRSGANDASAESAALVAAVKELTAAMQDQGSTEVAGFGRDQMLNAAMLLASATDQQIRSSAAEVLGRLGGKQAEKRLLEMARNDLQLANVAFSQLRQMGCRELMPILLDQLQSGTPEQKQHASSSLQGLVMPEHIPALVEVLNALSWSQQHPWQSIRSNLYNALGQTGHHAAAEALVLALKKETYEYGKQNICRALTQCVPGDNVEIYKQALAALGKDTQQNYGAFTQIIQILGQSGSYHASEVLIDFMGSSHHEYVRRTAAQSVMQLRDPVAAEPLCQLLNSEDYPEDQRRYLTQMIERAGYPGIRKVEGKYALVPEEEMKKLLAERAKALNE